MSTDTKEKNTQGILSGLRKLRPLSFLRELLVVILGILITFGINAWVGHNSRREALKETMHTVIAELEKNRAVIQKFREDFQTEQRIFRTIRDSADLHKIPTDTLEKYRNLPTDPFRISLTHYGLSVLENSNLIPTIKTTDFTAGLFQCYDELEVLQQRINNYAAIKEEAIQLFLFESESVFDFLTIYDHWELFLSHRALRNFILHSSPGYLGGLQQECAETVSSIDGMVARIRDEYRLGTP